MSLAKNILLPVDGSKFMERSIAYACNVVKCNKAKLTLLHVVTLPIFTETEAILDPKLFERSGKKILEEAKRLAKAGGVEAHTKMSEALGSPTHEILKVAEDGKFDLIIVGAKGHSMLRDLLIGSVSDGIVHHAPCPVLVVR